MTAEASIRVHEYPLTTGITAAPAFERKRLATHAVNCGTKCGHGCLYCSTGAMLRMHPSFQRHDENPFAGGYAIVDPTAPQRVARDAARKHRRGLVQLSTLTDAWAPEAKAHDLGRQCLEAIFAQPGWSVRVLTKSAEVRDDFDLLERYRDRTCVGLSVTAPPDRQEIVSALEPNASPIEERLLAWIEAAARGLRTYAMFCPLLPGVADSPDQIDWLIGLAEQCGAREIFVEPVNPRGPGLRRCQEALQKRGFTRQAEAFAQVRRRAGWSSYVVELLTAVQKAVRRYGDIAKLRFLLYPSRLQPADLARIRRDDAGVIWLGDDVKATSKSEATYP